MNNEAENLIDFDLDLHEHISLKAVIGNKHAVEMARAYVEEFYNQKAHGGTPMFKPILLVGQYGCKTFAQAASNSFGNTNFRHVCGMFFSGILDLNNYFAYGDYCSTYYIAQIDKLSPLNQYKLWRIMVEGRINYVDAETKIPISAPLRKNLIIYSAQNVNEISRPLRDQMGIIINLSALNENEINEVLLQRAKLMNLTCSSDDILSKIAEGCSGNVCKAVELLSLACCLMRAENETILMDKHVIRALYLDEQNTKAE